MSRTDNRGSVNVEVSRTYTVEYRSIMVLHSIPEATAFGMGVKERVARKDKVGQGCVHREASRVGKARAKPEQELYPVSRELVEI